MSSSILDTNCSVAEKSGMESQKDEENRKLVWRRKPSDASWKRVTKQDLLAQTVATLCHEVNNPLMAITASIEILLEGRDKLPPHFVDKIKQIEAAAVRIQSVFEKLQEIETIHYRETAAGKMFHLG